MRRGARAPGWASLSAGLILLGLGLATMPAFAGSPFAGGWTGPWHDEHGQSGVFSLEIDGSGTVAGSVTNGDMRGNVSGTIATTGDLEATYKYGVIPYHASIRLTLQGDHLRGIAHYSLPLGVPFDSGPIDLERD